MLTAADWREIRKTVGEECCLLFEEAFSGERVPSVSEWGAALSNIEAGGYKACPCCGTIHMRSGGCPACRPWRGLLGLGLAALAAGMAGCCLSLAPDAVPAAVLLLQNPGSLAECVGRLSWSAG